MITPQMWDAPSTPTQMDDSLKEETKLQHTPEVYKSPGYGSITSNTSKGSRFTLKRPQSAANRTRNANLDAFAKFQSPPKYPKTPTKLMHHAYTGTSGYVEIDNTLHSHRSGYTAFSGMNLRKTAKLMFGRRSNPPANYDADDEDRGRRRPLRRLQTAREYNKKFIMDRIQNVKSFQCSFLCF